MQLVRDVNECLATKNTEAGNVRLVPAPGLLGCAVDEGMCRGHVVKVHCILEGIPPIAIRELGINEHCANPLNKHAVHALRYPVVLWYVSRGHLMLDTLVLEKGLYLPSNVFAPSVRVEYLESMAGLELDMCNESTQVSGHLRLLLHGIDENLVGLVIDPGDKVGEALVRAGGKECTDF